MIKCPICGFGTDFFVSKKDRFGQEYRYVKCRRCNFLFDQDLFLDKNRLRDKTKKNYESDYFETIDTGWKMRGDIILKRLGIILSFLKLFRAKRISILDYGGGNGYIASKLSQYDVFYYDKFEKPIFKSNYKVLDYPEKKDVVLAVELAEHITDISEWGQLDKFCSLALIFTTEVTNRVPKLIDWPYLNPDAGHVSVHSFESLYLLAKKFGFFYIFFPSKSFHIFLRNHFLSNFNFVKIEYLIYNFLRSVRHILKNESFF